MQKTSVHSSCNIDWGFQDYQKSNRNPVQSTQQRLLTTRNASSVLVLLCKESPLNLAQGKFLRQVPVDWGPINFHGNLNGNSELQEATVARRCGTFSSSCFARSSWQATSEAPVPKSLSDASSRAHFPCDLNPQECSEDLYDDVADLFQDLLRMRQTSPGSVSRNARTYYCACQ